MKVNVSEKRSPKTGNPTTVVSNILHNPQVIDDLATKLKKSCGAGGFVKAKTITIHGSHTEKINQYLRKKDSKFLLSSSFFLEGHYFIIRLMKSCKKDVAINLS